MHHAYALLSVKSVDEKRHTVSGIASTPTTDRSGDIVVPMGARFKTPMPLLLYHKSDKPVGQVTFAKATPQGIPFTAEFPDVTEPGAVKDRVDEAWHSVKYGLTPAVSIGFQADPDGVEVLKTGGLQYNEWEWLELSLVSIPAQPDAVIQSFKSNDGGQIRRALGVDDTNESDEARRVLVNKITKKAGEAQASAATGQRRAVISKLSESSPGASGNINPPQISGSRNKGNEVKTLQEQIQAFQVKKESLQTQIGEIVNKSLETGETLDAETKQKRSDLASEIREIDEHIVMLKDSESLMLTKATVVAPRSVEGNTEKGHEQTSHVRGTTVVTAQQVLPKGIAFTRIVALLATNKGKADEALKAARDMYPNETNLHSVLKMIDSTPRGFLQKAAVSGGTTVGTTWASPLVFYQNAVSDFIEYLRPKTIIGRIPGMTPVPFKVSVPRQTGGGSAYWVGEGQPKPLTNLAFDRVTLDITKIATIAVITDELARLGSPSAEAITRDQLAAAIIQQMDSDFVDPANGGITNIKPASITSGVTPITSSGNNEASIRTDIQRIFQPWIINNVDPTSGVWIMPASTALALSLLVNGLGQPSFPGITMSGGTFWGMPVVVSEAAGLLSGTTGGNIVLLNAKSILLADDGQVTVDASTEASLEMLTNPTNNSATPTATAMVSMFQTDSIAIRAERYINWVKSRPTAAQYINGVHWGQ